MKKKMKKLELFKETVRDLESSNVEKVRGGFDPSVMHPCKPDTVLHCG